MVLWFPGIVPSWEIVWELSGGDIFKIQPIWLFLLTRSQLWSSPGEVAQHILWGRLGAERLERGLYTYRTAVKQRRLVARLEGFMWDSQMILCHLRWRNSCRFNPVICFCSPHLRERHLFIILKTSICSQVTSKQSHNRVEIQLPLVVFLQSYIFDTWTYLCMYSNALLMMGCILGNVMRWLPFCDCMNITESTCKNRLHY